MNDRVKEGPKQFVPVYFEVGQIWDNDIHTLRVTEVHEGDRVVFVDSRGQSDSTKIPVGVHWWCDTFGFNLQWWKQ